MAGLFGLVILPILTNVVSPMLRLEPLFKPWAERLFESEVPYWVLTVAIVAIAIGINHLRNHYADKLDELDADAYGHSHKATVSTLW